MEVELHHETCYIKTCNVFFWITKKHHNQLVKFKNTFYCPNGHPQSYTGENDAEKAERYKNYLANAENRLNMQRRSNAALRGVITRMRNKAEE